MGEKRAIRVMIVDDHEAIRRGLASYLEGSDDFELVASVGSGEEAVRMCPRVHPDVVLMDVSMPQMDGIEATKRIKKEQPEAVIIAVSVNDTPHLRESMHMAGASAFVSKEEASERLYETIMMLTSARTPEPLPTTQTE